MSIDSGLDKAILNMKFKLIEEFKEIMEKDETPSDEEWVNFLEHTEKYFIYLNRIKMNK